MKKSPLKIATAMLPNICACINVARLLQPSYIDTHTDMHFTRGQGSPLE